MTCAQLTRLQAAQYALLEYAPFFGCMASELQIVPPSQAVTHIKTACITSTGLLSYNPSFVASLTDEQVLTLVAHEAGHIALDIFSRAEGLDLKITNKAHDYCVNEGLITSGFKPIENWLCSEQYFDMSFDEIYVHLLDKRSKSKQGNNEGNCGQGNDNDTNASLSDCFGDSTIEDILNKEHGLTKSKRKDVLQRFKDAVKKAYEFDKRHPNSIMGSLPGNFQSTIEDIVHPKVKIEDYIKGCIGRYGQKVKYCYGQRNRRNSFQMDDVYNPGRKADKPAIYVLIDTSGSMFWDDDKNLLANALGFVLKTSMDSDIPVHIYQADADEPYILSESQLRESVKNKKLDLYGGGGSDFRPAFNKICHDVTINHPMGAPVFAFTDGMIAVPEKHEISPDTANRTVFITNKTQSSPANGWGHHFTV